MPSHPTSSSFPFLRSDVQHPFKTHCGHSLPRSTTPGLCRSHDIISEDDRINLSVQLRHRFKDPSLFNLPGGFPFHYSMNGSGFGKLSHQSYEFREDIHVHGLDGIKKSYCVVIFFTNPTNYHESSCIKPQNRLYTWRASISVPPPTWCHSHHDNFQIPLAIVQLDPNVLKTPYGNFIHQNPAVILSTLALSLEWDSIVTIVVADSHSDRRPSSRHNWALGDILFISTNSSNQKRVIRVVRISP